MISIKTNVLALVACAGLWTGTVAQAASIDLNGNRDSFRLTYATYTSKKVMADGGVLVADDNNRQSQDMFHLGASLVNKNVRFGVRGAYMSPANLDLLSLGVGLNVRFGLSKNVFFDVGGYYAPELLSLMDSAGYTELDGRLSFNVTEPLDLYVGYRNIKFKIENVRNKLEVDDDLYVGLKFYF